MFKKILILFVTIGVMIAISTTLTVSAASNDVTGIESGKYYYITNLYTGHYLDVQGGSIKVNGTNVGCYGYHDGANQKWKAVRNSNGKYTFPVYYDNSFVLNVIGNDVTIWKKSLPVNQEFTLVRDTSADYGGTYYIKYGTKYLTVNPTDNNVMLSSSNGLNAMWSFEAVDKGDADLYTFSEFLPSILTPKSWFDGKMQSLGYTPCYYNDWFYNLALSWMDNDSMWFHNGHGGPGYVQFYDGNLYEGYITANNIRAKTANQLAGLRCFITMGCSSGASTSGDETKVGVNLMREVFNKGGQFALGFTHTQYIVVSDTWLKRFIDEANKDITVKQCLQNADFILAAIPFLGTGAKYYRGDVYQRLTR